jgi:hypothetical protein
MIWWLNFTAEVTDDMGRCWRVKRLIKFQEGVSGAAYATRIAYERFFKECEERALVLLPPFAVYIAFSHVLPQNGQLISTNCKSMADGLVGFIWEELLCLTEPAQPTFKRKKGGKANGQG